MNENYTFAGIASNGLRKDVHGACKRLEAKKERIKFTEMPKQWLEDFAVEFTFSSNKVEGGTYTLEETKAAITKGERSLLKSEQDYADTVGHYEAFNESVKIAKERRPLMVQDIVQLHSLLLPSKKGLRQNNVRVGGYEPPKFELVPKLLQKSIDVYSAALNEKPVIAAIAQYHYEFEKIHPFADGNGRTGRLIMSMELMKFGYLPVGISPQAKVHYMKCLQGGNIQAVQRMEDWLIRAEERQLNDFLAYYKM